MKSERLSFRYFNQNDASCVMELAGDPAISATTLRIPYPYPLAAALEWIKTHQADRIEKNAHQFAICLKPDQNIIGAVGLFNVEPEHKNGEIGYWIGKSYWNKGYATEAVRTVIRFAFNSLHLHRVHAHVFSQNRASARVLENAGLQYEGTMKEHVLKNGRFINIDFYGLVNSF